MDWYQRSRWTSLDCHPSTAEARSSQRFLVSELKLTIKQRKLFLLSTLNYTCGNVRSVRRGHRASRRKMSIPKASQQSWSQTMRTLVKNGFNKATTLSKRSGKDGLDKQPRSSSSSSYPTANSNVTGTETAVRPTKSSARRLPSAETEASGTGSSQTWEDYGTSTWLLIFFLFLFSVCRPFRLIRVIIDC